MKKFIFYNIILFLTFAACEDIYNPGIEQAEKVLVVDARINARGGESFVRLTKTLGFNESEVGYPAASGAKVTILSSENQKYELNETEEGIFPVYFSLNPELEYKLMIDYAGDIYESIFEPVPAIPDMDTVFGIPEKQLFLTSGANGQTRTIERVGVQLYANILNEKEMPYYKFTATKVLEYSYTIEVGDFELVIFGWNSFSPKEDFNIAAPPEFSLSKDITKHPLFFMEKKPNLVHTHEYYGIPQKGNTSFKGWILIIQQYGLSSSAYNHYNDLNSQLNSEGRLFDPLYVQANGNIKCLNNNEKVVLGNFEITQTREHRFFVRYASEKLGYYLIPINEFYDIPTKGEVPDTPPPFWEPK